MTLFCVSVVNNRGWSIFFLSPHVQKGTNCCRCGSQLDCESIYVSQKIRLTNFFVRVCVLCMQQAYVVNTFYSPKEKLHEFAWLQAAQWRRKYIHSCRLIWLKQRAEELRLETTQSIFSISIGSKYACNHISSYGVAPFFLHFDIVQVYIRLYGTCIVCSRAENKWILLRWSTCICFSSRFSSLYLRSVSTKYEGLLYTYSDVWTE